MFILGGFFIKSPFFYEVSPKSINVSVYIISMGHANGEYIKLIILQLKH